MFLEVSRLTYHSPITIETLTYRVLLGYAVVLVQTLTLPGCRLFRKPASPPPDTPAGCYVLTDRSPDA